MRRSIVRTVFGRSMAPTPQENRHGSTKATTTSDAVSTVRNAASTSALRDVAKEAYVGMLALYKGHPVASKSNQKLPQGARYGLCATPVLLTASDAGGQPNLMGDVRMVVESLRADVARAGTTVKYAVIDITNARTACNSAQCEVFKAHVGVAMHEYGTTKVPTDIPYRGFVGYDPAIHSEAYVGRLLALYKDQSLEKAKAELKEAETKQEKAETKLKEAKAELKEAETKQEKAETKLKEAEAKLKEAELKEAELKILESIRKASMDSSKIPDLTEHLPFGMLGRDECVTEIKTESLKNGIGLKFPPMVVISTSRAGKTLMLDHLRKEFNGEGRIFVVTCSMNGSRSSCTTFMEQCTSSGPQHYVRVVLNLLLYGSVGMNDKPEYALPESLVDLDGVRLCAIIRENYRLKPTTNLLFAIDELTPTFDRFSERDQKTIVSTLNLLSSGSSHLLITGFTANAQKAFLGANKRDPTRVFLHAIRAENRYQFIPLMTVLLWGIRGQIGANASTQALTYFYCVAHEVLKSSPGLMGSIACVLMFRSSQLAELYGDRATMWDVIEQLIHFLPDRLHFRGDTRLKCGLENLDGYLTHSDETKRTECYDKLMGLNMAAPRRLDVFRILMVFIESKRHPESSDRDLPAVEILKEFMDHFNTLYWEWGNPQSGGKVKPFHTVKGSFFEVACRYGLRLLWLQLKSGVKGLDTPLRGHELDSDRFGDLKVSSFCKHFPLTIGAKDEGADTKMFKPNTLLYPAGKNGKSENNPLVDLVLNMPTKTGLSQIWVQVKHTLVVKPLLVSTLRTAMSVVDKYNGQVLPPDQVIVKVLYLFVAPSQFKVQIKNDKSDSRAKGVVTDGKDWCLKDKKSTPLTIRCVTSVKDRESLLGEFISQLIPDFESHDSFLEASLEKKVSTMSALNRISRDELEKKSKTDEPSKELLKDDNVGRLNELDEKRRDLHEKETKFFQQSVEGVDRFAGFPIPSKKLASLIR